MVAMTTETLEYALCWWCGESFPKEKLVHLEGARLVGSEPLTLPDRIADKAAVLVCEQDAIRFALARRAHDVEVFEAAVGGPRAATSILEIMAESMGEEEIERVERMHGKTVADRLRRYLAERKKE